MISARVKEEDLRLDENQPKQERNHECDQSRKDG